MKGFNNLELFFKCDLLKWNGRYLISTGYYHYTVKLFSWEGFLIEQYFDNEVKMITGVTLAVASDLDKYLKEISLADLGVASEAHDPHK